MKHSMECPMHISDGELLAMTRDLAQLHNDTRPRYLAAIGNVADGLGDAIAQAAAQRRGTASRRNFLRGGLVSAGALGGGVLVAACGSSSSTSSAPSGAAASASGGSADLTVARLAASLEVLAVSTYQTAVMAAGQGKFGPVPPAFAVFAQTAMGQHKDHGDAWNSALSKAGQQAQTAPDPKYQQVVQSALPGLKTIADVAGLALTLETVALETYTKGSMLVTDKANRLVALTIAPVEAQHAAILSYVLGKYPVPDTFIKTDMAASPADLGGA